MDLFALRPGPALDTLPAGSWGKLSKWGKLLGKRAGPGKRLEPRFSIPTGLTPSLLPWNQTTQRSRCRPWAGRALGPAPQHQTRGNKRIKDGVGNESSLHYR